MSAVGFPGSELLAQPYSVNVSAGEPVGSLGSLRARHHCFFVLNSLSITTNVEVNLRSEKNLRPFFECGSQVGMGLVRCWLCMYIVCPIMINDDII
jgi:hypothetical protein